MTKQGNLANGFDARCTTQLINALDAAQQPLFFLTNKTMTRNQIIKWKKVPSSFKNAVTRNNRYVYCRWSDNSITTEQLIYDSFYNENGKKIYSVYLECNPLRPVYYAEIQS